MRIVIYGMRGHHSAKQYSFVFQYPVETKTKKYKFDTVL